LEDTSLAAVFVSVVSVALEYLNPGWTIPTLVDK